MPTLQRLSRITRRLPREGDGIELRGRSMRSEPRSGECTDPHEGEEGRREACPSLTRPVRLPHAVRCRGSAHRIARSATIVPSTVPIAATRTPPAISG